MTWTEICDAYTSSDWTAIRAMAQSWLWEPPTPLPEMWDTPPLPAIVAPHIPIRRFKTFTGHKFGFGGKK